jgi:uncharacterized protein YbcI
MSARQSQAWLDGRDPVPSADGAARRPLTAASVAHRSEEEPFRSPLLEISNAVVRIFKEVFGRGPTKARASFAGPDTVVVVLEECMTIPERKLEALGYRGRILESRLILQRELLERQLGAVIEEHLARVTRGLVGGLDPGADVAAVVFLLEPARGGAEWREAPALRRAVPGPGAQCAAVAAGGGSPQ